MEQMVGVGQGGVSEVKLEGSVVLVHSHRFLIVLDEMDQDWVCKLVGLMTVREGAC